MKKKCLLKYLIIYISMILILLGSLYIATIIPREKITEHVTNSYDYFNDKERTFKEEDKAQEPLKDLKK